MFFVTSISINAQSYLGYTNNSVNFRSSPNTNSSIFNTLQPGSLLFLVDMKTINGYYSVIEIATNTEGYVHSNYVDISKEIPENTESVFTPISETNNYKPEISVFNNTSQSLTLKLNEVAYNFTPQQKRKITTSVGSCSYIASSSGVIPYFGTENLRSNYSYEWEFYITTNDSPNYQFEQPNFEPVKLSEPIKFEPIKLSEPIKFEPIKLSEPINFKPIKFENN